MSFQSTPDSTTRDPQRALLHPTAQACAVGTAALRVGVEAPNSQRFRSWRWELACWELGVCVLACFVLQPVVHTAGRQISFRTEDGRTINGFLMESSRPPSAAVVLVGMLGRSKDDWEPVAQRLEEANMTALAIDLPQSSLPDTAEALASWHRDILACVRYLSVRSDIRADAIGAAGASLGANLAVVAAAADPRIRSLVLISPSLDYRGVRIESALRQYGSRPALLIASSRDPYAARTVRELTKDPPGVRDGRLVDTFAHGTLLLARDPNLVRAMVEWFQRTLGVN
jgi:dienelactone hydrolase